MSAKKLKSAEHSPVPPGPESYSVDLVLFHPTIPGSEQLQSAEALGEVLAYVEQEAENCNFRELSHFAGTARLAATELVHALNENRSED